MVTYLNEKKMEPRDDVRAFLAGTTEIEFSIEGKDARYRWIEQTLRRLKYRTLARRERGLVLRYLERVSGYSRQSITRSDRLRRKPSPQGQVGCPRLGTVHQGNLNGINGVYNINAVDEGIQL